MMPTGSSAPFEDNPPGTVRAAAVALEHNTARSHVHSSYTLGFLATGAFQRELANRLGLCQSTMQAKIKMQFAVRAGFPNVIGAIDCQCWG